jgi:hypothetical protein
MGMITVEGPASGRPYRVNISGDAPTPEEQARIDQFLAQSEAPYLQMYNELFGATTPVAPEAPVEEDDGTAIGRGFRSGIQNIRSLIGTTIEETGRAAGLEGVQEFGRGMETAAEEEFRKLREIRERTGLYDVEDVGSALTYGGETFGEQAPILAQTLAGTATGAGVGSFFGPVGTGVGAVVGGALASLPLLFGGNVQRQEEQVAAGELDEVNVQRALLTAIPQAALESIAAKVLAFTPLRGGTGNIWARAGKGGAAGVATEVPTEITQQLLERAQAGLPIDSDDAIKEYIEAGVAAGILGGPIGAAGGIAQRDVAQQELDQDRKELEAEGSARLQFADQTEREIEEDRAKALASTGIDPDAPLGRAGPQQRLALPAPETVDVAPETAIADEEFANLSFNKAQYERVLQQVKADITRSKPQPAPQKAEVDVPSSKPQPAPQQAEVDVPSSETLSKPVSNPINIPAIHQRVKADIPGITVSQVRDIMKELQARGFVAENPASKKNKFIPMGSLAPEVKTPDVSYRRQIDTAADFIKADQTTLERLQYDLRSAEAYGRDLEGNRVTPNQVNAKIASIEQSIAKNQQIIEFANQRLKTLGRDTHVPRIERVGLPPNMKAVPVAEGTPDALRPRFEAQQAGIRGMKEQISSVNKQVRKLNEQAKKRTLSSIELDRMQKLQEQQADLSTRLGEAQANLKTPEKIFQEAKNEQIREQERQREIVRKLVAARARAAADQVKAQEDQDVSPFSPAFNAKQANVFGALRKRLTNLGLKDVRLEGAQRIEGAEGSFDPVTKVLSLAMGLYDPKMTDQQLFDAISEVMNHEVIHALRAMGLLKPNEIKVLERFAGKTKYVKRTKDGTQKRNYTYLDRAKNLYSDLTPTQQKEEAIAEMFRDYVAGRLKLGGGPRSLFEKIKKFFKSLIGANVDNGFNSVEDIFQGIRRGEIGARDRVAPATQPAAIAAPVTQPAAAVAQPTDAAKADIPAANTGRKVDQGSARATETRAATRAALKLKSIPFDQYKRKPNSAELIPGTNVRGEAEIIDLGSRKMVMRDVNGVQVPFYLSSGLAGKKDVAAGKWYPFLGIGPDGWINKGSQQEINDYYGSPELRATAQELDSTIGDIRNDTSVPKVKPTGVHIDAINAGLNPTANSQADTRDAFDANLAALLDKINSGRIPPEAKAAPATQPAAAPSAAPSQAMQSRLIATDNPGGSWLQNKRRRAEEDMRTADPSSSSSKGLTGAITAYMPKPINLPVDILSSLSGANDEVRRAGDARYDELAADVARRGFVPDQDGNAVVVGVNHLGQAYLKEGNTRVAVARDFGVPSVRAEVRWFNGGELADGPFSPSVVERLAASAPSPSAAPSQVMLSRLPTLPMAPDGTRAHQLPSQLLMRGTGAAPLVNMTQKYTPGNAAANNAAIQQILDQYPNAMSSEREWAEAMQASFGGDFIPVPPMVGLQYAQSPEKMAEKLRKLTPELKKGVDKGFEYVKKIRDVYNSGNASPRMTLKLFIWGILSRGAGPVQQESAFIDIIDNAYPIIQKATRQPLTEDDIDMWMTTVSRSIPEGSPGKQVTMNVNAAANLVRAMSQLMPGSNQTVLGAVHDAMSDPNANPADIRQFFLSNTQGAGIDNKVLSFILLVGGKDDVLVMDRIQGRHLWDDGRFGGANIYDGIGKQKAGLNGIFRGPYGILTTRILENGLRQNVSRAYELIGRPEDASLGRFHWETWVIEGEQVVSHDTLAAVFNDSSIGQSVTEGKTDTLSSGMTYRRGEVSTVVEYPLSNGDVVYMKPERFKEFTTALADDAKKAKSSTGVFKEGKFKVTARADIPWFDRPDVDRGALDTMAREYENARPDGSVLVGTERAREGQDASQRGNSDLDKRYSRLPTDEGRSERVGTEEDAAIRYEKLRRLKVLQLSKARQGQTKS